VIRKATFEGPERIYRYNLERIFTPQPEGKSKSITFLMLNPSTADENVDDPTIRRCIGFANLWEFDRLFIVNLFPFRTPDPRELFKRLIPYTNTKENNRWICNCVLKSKMTIAAWGSQTHQVFKERRDEVLQTLNLLTNDLYALRVNKDGNPAHPLFLPNSVKPEPYIPGRQLNRGQEKVTRTSRLSSETPSGLFRS